MLYSPVVSIVLVAAAAAAAIARSRDILAARHGQNSWLLERGLDHDILARDVLPRAPGPGSPPPQQQMSNEPYVRNAEKPLPPLPVNENLPVSSILGFSAPRPPTPPTSYSKGKATTNPGDGSGANAPGPASPQSAKSLQHSGNLKNTSPTSPNSNRGSSDRKSEGEHPNVKRKKRRIGELFKKLRQHSRRRYDDQVLARAFEELGLNKLE